MDKDPINESLLLCLKMKEGSGLITQDWAIPHHKNPTLTGAPSWAVLASDKNVLDFDIANPDFIKILQADTVDLNFTTDDFSLGVWIYANTLSSTSFLFERGLVNTDGYQFIIGSRGKLVFTTSQGGAIQETFTDDSTIVTEKWYFLMLTRSGAVAKIYVNGVNVVTNPVAHTNPLTSARDFRIGTWESELSPDSFDGKMGEVYIWERALEPKEIKRLYEMTKGRYE